MGIERKNKIYSVTFEGMHRVGKGTQIELLKEKLTDVGIPRISIRGEGYRQGSGTMPHDPRSDFWEKLAKQLKEGNDLKLKRNLIKVSPIRLTARSSSATRNCSSSRRYRSLLQIDQLLILQIWDVYVSQVHSNPGSNIVHEPAHLGIKDGESRLYPFICAIEHCFKTLSLGA
jgi:hypothetical protein